MFPPPSIFNPARIHCPSCNATLTNLPETCSFCGFNARLCVQRFPFTPPPLKRFVDPDDCLSAKHRREIGRPIRKLERRFPQVRVSVCVMELPEGVDGREFAYWYINRCPVDSDEERRQRLYQMLLVVDRTTKTMSVCVGYGLDCFIDDIFLQRSLEKASKAFRNKGYSGSIAAWLRIVERELVYVHQEARYAVQRWERHGGTPAGAEPDLAAEQVLAQSAATTKIPPKPRKSNTATLIQ